jgi:hypothetical protein
MKKVLLATIALSFVAGHAFAAGTTANSTSASGAEAVAVAMTPDPSSSGDPSGDPAATSTTQTIHNTPDIAISSYAGGTNPCGIGGQLGVAVAGFGIGGGIATVSKECTMRAWYVLLAATAGHTHNPVYMQWATGIACANADLRRVAPPGVCSPIAVSYAAPPVPPRPAMRVAQAQQPEQYPAWCATVTGPAERARFRVDCGFVR